MASDKEGDRSLSGGSYGGREGTGGGPGGPAGTGRNSGTNSGSSSGFSGGGTQSGPGGNQSKSGSGSAPSGKSGGTASGSGSNTGGREGTGGGPGGPAGTGRASGTNATGGAGGARSVTSTTGYTGGGPTGGAPAPTRGLGIGLSPARSATTTPSAITPSLAGTAVRAAATPTGFTPDFNRRPDLNPAVAADAKVQAALGTIRSLEHRTTPMDLSVYSKVFGGKTVPGLTDTSIRDMIAYQKTMPRSRAIGAYQIKDLATAARLAGISLDAPMSISTQDRMAKALAANRMRQATKNGAVDVDEFAHRLSREWASFADPKTGVSHYPSNNNAAADPRATRTVAEAFLSLAPAATAATSPAAATSANVPTPTARPSPVNSFATRRDVPVGALQAAATERVVSKYLGAGRPMGVVPAPTPQPTSAAAQAVINDLRQRDAEYGLGPSAGGAGLSGVTPMSAGVTYAGSTPPSQALAPGPVGAGFSSAIAPERHAPAPSGDRTRMDSVSLRDTRMSGIEYGPRAPVTSPETDYVAQSLANAPRNVGAAPPPSQALAPGPIGAGFSSAIAPSIAAPAGPATASIDPNLVGTAQTKLAGPIPRDVMPYMGQYDSLYQRAGPSEYFAPPATTPTVSTLSTVPGTVPPAGAPTAAAAPTGLGQALAPGAVGAGFSAPSFTAPPPQTTTGVPTARPEQQYDSIAGRITLHGQPLSIDRFKAQSPAFRQSLSNFGKLQKGPINLNSLDRNKAENLRVKGATASEHLDANAMDLDISSLSKAERVQTVVNLRAAGFTRMIAYSGNTAIHADMKNVAPPPGYDVYPMFDRHFANMPQAHDWYKEGLAQPIDRAAVSLALGGPGDVGPAAGATPPAVTAAPGSTTAATTTTTPATTTTAPAGTGPATGPWGDDKPDKVTGPRAPEPMTQKQQTGAFLTKLGLPLAGPAGEVIVAVDVLTELFTGQGLIDRAWAASDNPQTGPNAKGFGDYTGNASREPTVGAVKANQRVMDKYLKPQTPVTPPAVAAPVETTFNDPTWRPTPEQKWGAKQSKYSEYPYATA